MSGNDASQSIIPNAFYRAVSQFNDHQFWECHETLEDLWRVVPEPEKTFLQGIIQVAAGFHHLSRGNTKGALSLLTQGLDKLHQVMGLQIFQDWIDLSHFIQAIEDAKARIGSVHPVIYPRLSPKTLPEDFY